MEVLRELAGRFPLLERVRVAPLAGNTPEAIPPYVALLLAVGDAPHGKPLGFIFPRKGELGRITAVAHALHQLDRKLPQAIEEHITRTFPPNTKVKLKPAHFVYRLEWVELHPSVRVRISQLDRPTSAIVRNFTTPAELLRLEPTNLNAPRGTLTNFRANPEPHPLDHILATPTFGNRSLMHNEVLVLDTQAAFRDFAAAMCLRPAAENVNYASVAQLLPLGSLTEATSSRPTQLRNWDEANIEIEPLIAVTSSIEKLADFCGRSQKGSKLVIINDASLIKNLQAFDELVASQRVLLFLDEDEREQMEMLAKRKCRFWRLNWRALEAGNGPDAGSVFGAISRWATNHAGLDMEAEPCADLGLDSVCGALEGLRGTVDADPEGPGARLAKRAWGLLNEAARFVQPPTPEEQTAFVSQIERARRDLAFNPAAIRADATSAIRSALDGLAAVTQFGTRLGAEKGRLLSRLLQNFVRSEGARCALLARSPSQVAALERWAQRSGLQSIPVFSLRTLPEDAAFAAIVCASWPGVDFMRKAAARLVAPRVIVVAYPFEQRWVKQCERHLRQRPILPSLSREEMGALLNVTGESAGVLEQDEPASTTPATVSASADQFDIWTMEHHLRNARKGGHSVPSDGSSVEARYVSFVGDSFAYLTESFRLPTVNDVVAGTARPGQKLPERRARELKLGDFVVFPSSGGTEIIHQIADRLIGPEAPKLRGLAHVWKDALINSRMTQADFAERARQLGLQRDPVTIRHWFTDESQIGPRDRDAVELVAKITGYSPLADNIERVWKAMENLRGKSISAGACLRDVLLKKLPLVLDRVEEQGSAIEIDELGSAWVVQVESVADESEPRARGEVNRLWWDDGERAQGELL